MLSATAVALIAALYPTLPALIGVAADDTSATQPEQVFAPAHAADDYEPPPAPYVMPISLRAVSPSTGVRLDTVVAPFNDPTTGRGETETVGILSTSLKISKHFALTAKVAAVRNEQPVTTTSSAANGISNPIFGASFGTNVGRHFRFAASAGIGVPVGSGGGNTPDAGIAAAMKAAAFARSSFDNTLFSVNDLGVPVAVDAGYSRGGFTTQIGASLIPSGRVKGEAVSPDASKLNSTAGAFVGYFILPELLSVGAELRYQRYLSTPVAITKDPTQRDNTTAGGGIRGYFSLSDNTKFRPGVSYSAGIEGAVSDRHYQMVQLDLPFSF